LDAPSSQKEGISIVATPPQSVPPSQERAALSKRLSAFFDARASKVTHIADEEIDRVIDEAVRHERHSRRP